MAILLLAPFSPDVLHVNYFCTKTITDQKANLLQIKNQIYHRSKIKSITDQKPNLSQIKTKSITDQKPNLLQIKNKIYYRSDKEILTTLVSVCWSNILWLNLSRRNVKVTLTRKYPIQVDTSLYSAVLNYVYTLRFIGPISYPGECDLMVNVRKYSVIFSRMHFVTVLYVYNMHQDTKSARLIAVCKRIPLG